MKNLNSEFYGQKEVSKEEYMPYLVFVFLHCGYYSLYGNQEAIIRRQSKTGKNQLVEIGKRTKVAVQKVLDETQLLFDSLIQEYFG